MASKATISPQTTTEHRRRSSLSAVAPAQRDPLPMNLLKTARPRQWVKNLLVFAAPGAGGVLSHGSAFARTAVAFAAFCLAASGSYFLNDASDAAADRLHPKKMHRPVAAGRVTVPIARTAGIGLIVASFGVSLVLRDWRFLVIIGMYLALTISYTLWLKRIEVIDLVVVASGFIIRALAGGVATGIPISRWFIIVTSFGSLFVVASRRHAEHLDLGESRDEHRATLGRYSTTYLGYVRGVTSAIAISAYCLWAFERSSPTTHVSWFELSIAPFVVAMLRYALLVDSGEGGAPEELMLRDRGMQISILVWLVLVVLGIYLP
jgi:decaprenyl-phosphate phosphoribosyltransferase